MLGLCNITMVLNFCMAGSLHEMRVKWDDRSLHLNCGRPEEKLPHLLYDVTTFFINVLVKMFRELAF